MNYPYPIPGSQTNIAAFVASSTLILGTYDKPLDARTLITVDYTHVVPAITPVIHSIRVAPGGEPQLTIDTVVIAAGVMTFYLSGGMAGRAYELTITVATGKEKRSDILTVQMLDDGRDYPSYARSLPPVDGVVSGDGSVIANSVPRFFLSGTPPVGANVLDRWYDTTSGNIYDYVSSGNKNFWQLMVVGGGGTPPTDVATIVKLAPITPDGTTTIFTLRVNTGAPANVITTSDLFVSVDGVWQEPLIQYLASGARLTFTSPPDADSKIFMLWFMAPTASEAGGDGANIVKMQPITPDGVTTSFILVPTGATPIAINGANYLFVSVDGVWQESGAQYVASGNLITFIEAPRADAQIFILWFAPPLPT
jgi:hypothetical protein